MPSSTSCLAKMGWGVLFFKKKKKGKKPLSFCTTVESKLPIPDTFHMMELLFPGQAWRELFHRHIPRAPEAIGRYKTPLSLQTQLKMWRFSHVIHMALAGAGKTKPPGAYSCERQSYLSELQLCLEEDGGGRLIFCQRRCCRRCLCQSTGQPCKFA